MNKQPRTREEELNARRAYYDMLSCPEDRAARIASHYMAHAHVAVALKQATRMRRDTGGTKDLDELIERHVRIITNGHLNDFGIALEWEEQTTNQQPI